jgi:hypothetical protein
MLEPKLLTQEIDAALQANLTALREAFCDLLAALIMIIISLLSFLHAVLRVVFATLGLLLWTIALVITLLYGARSWAVSQSTSTLHRR